MACVQTRWPQPPLAAVLLPMRRDDGVDWCPTDLLLNRLYLANSTL